MNPAAPAPADLETLFTDFDPARYPLIARSTQGVIVRVNEMGTDLAVKIPTGRGLTRRLLTTALRREYRAYQRVAGMDGFARCYGLFRDSYLALEYLQAKPLKQVAPHVPGHFYQRLLDLIENMHARGVAHGDLKSRQNVMVDATGEPIIVDLGTSVVKRQGWHPINQRLFSYMCRIDRNSWIKLKYGGYDNVDEADRHLLDRSLIERINSRIRRR
jgi:serine/threonine protein kinase